MIQIVDKLNEISEAMGGQAAETNQIVDALEEIKKVAPSGESPLPAVTAEDDGYVLTVVDGEWDKAAQTSGASVYVYAMRSVNTSVEIDAGATRTIEMELETAKSNPSSEIPVVPLSVATNGLFGSPIDIVEFSFYANSEGIGGLVRVRNASSSAVTVGYNNILARVLTFTELESA